MKTIVKVAMADCDRSTDDGGNFIDNGYQYVVCDNDDIHYAYGWFDTAEEARAYIAE